MIMTPPQCPAARTRGFALTLVLVLLALVTGLGVVLTLHTGHFVQADRLRTLDVELRQMIDSGIAYAHLHRGVWPAGSEPVILDGTELTGGNRTATITLQPTFGANHTVEAVTVTARMSLPRDRTRSATARVVWSDTPTAALL